MRLDDIYGRLDARTDVHIEALPKSITEPSEVALVYLISRASGVSVLDYPIPIALKYYKDKIADDMKVFQDTMVSNFIQCVATMEDEDTHIELNFYIQGNLVLSYYEDVVASVFGGSSVIIPTSREITMGPIRSLLDKFAFCSSRSEFIRLMHILYRMHRDKIIIPELGWHRDLSGPERFLSATDGCLKEINRYLCRNTVDSALLFSNFNLLFNDIVSRIPE